MNKERLSYLLRQLTGPGLSASEQDELKAFVRAEPNREQFIEAAQEVTQHIAPLEFSEDKWLTMIQSITQVDKSPAGPVAIRSNSFVEHFLRRRLRYAAAIALVLAGAAFYFFYRPISATKPVAAVSVSPGPAMKCDPAPGGDRAILTLSDGSSIALDSVMDGAIAVQGGAQVRKVAKGQISYNTGSVREGAAVMYNTMTTPRGGQFEVTLPDGTRVWLNAASSITYPTVFSAKDRTVRVTGEAYLEVAKNQNAPFRVEVNGMKVEVLGTHFNVNAYADEKITSTTLLEGSVKIITGNQQAMIRPGEQAQVSESAAGRIRVASDVDVAQVIAWQKGLFEFSDADLPSIMRQVSRWYDVDVVFEGAVTSKKFGGGISRKLPLSNLLKMLGSNGVRFDLQGKKLVVN